MTAAPSTAAPILSAFAAGPLCAETPIADGYGTTGRLEAFAAPSRVGPMPGPYRAKGGTLKVPGAPVAVTAKDHWFEPVQDQAGLEDIHAENTGVSPVGTGVSAVALADTGVGPVNARRAPTDTAGSTAADDRISNAMRDRDGPARLFPILARAGKSMDTTATTPGMDWPPTRATPRLRTAVHQAPRSMYPVRIRVADGVDRATPEPGIDDFAIPVRK
jgi:hypothetical protein